MPKLEDLIEKPSLETLSSLLGKKSSQERREEEQARSSSSWTQKLQWRGIYSFLLAVLLVIVFCYLGLQGISLIDGFHLAGG